MNQLCSTFIICGLLVLHGPAIVVAETLPIDIPAELASSTDDAVESSEVAVVDSIVLDEGLLAQDIIQAPQVDSDMLNTLLSPENASLDPIDTEAEIVLDVLQSALITSDIVQLAGEDSVESIAVVTNGSESGEVIPVVEGGVAVSENIQAFVETVPASEIVVPVEVGSVVVEEASSALEQPANTINEDGVVKSENQELLKGGDSSAEETSEVLGLFDPEVDGEASESQEDVLEVVDELAEPEILDEELVQSELTEDVVADIPTTAQEIQELRVYVDSLPVMPIKQRRVLPYQITNGELNTVSSVPVVSVPVIQASVVSIGQSNGARRAHATIT